MNSNEDQNANENHYTSRPAISIAILAAIIIVSLVLIRQFEQFQLRPASGTAAALSEAAAAPKHNNLSH